MPRRLKLLSGLLCNYAWMDASTAHCLLQYQANRPRIDFVGFRTSPANMLVRSTVHLSLMLTNSLTRCHGIMSGSQLGRPVAVCKFSFICRFSKKANKNLEQIDLLKRVKNSNVTLKGDLAFANDWEYFTPGTCVYSVLYLSSVLTAFRP